MPQPESVQKSAKAGDRKVSKEDFLSLASFLEGRDRMQRVHKRDSHGEALREAGEMFGSREFVSAYEYFKPVYGKVVADMQRVLARNPEFEASKLAKEQQKPLSVAKENIQNRRAHAQQVIDEFDRLRRELESKPLVRHHLKKGASGSAAAPPPVEVSPSTIVSNTNETRVDAIAPPSPEVTVGHIRYLRASYVSPEQGSVYAVRDKTGSERVIRVLDKNSDGSQVQIETMDKGKSSTKPIWLNVESLARQAAKGWCHTLLAKAEKENDTAAANPAPAANLNLNVTMRLDIQNFGRCCADIARANIKFDTQLIKDIGDGPFRAGNYEQAFLTFEQIAVGFTSAVTNSRQAIANGRRALAAEKGNLSGKEIQERTAAFVRSEQLIHTAEREFSTILEGLRMYLRAAQG
jgi:hypothetical protein